LTMKRKSLSLALNPVPSAPRLHLLSDSPRSRGVLSRGYSASFPLGGDFTAIQASLSA